MALIDKASLLMVPSTYEDGTLYNVLPSGNKAPDETGNHNGYDQTRADFTFSRGSNLAATRVNASGLIEKGRENLVLHSNSFDNAAWSKLNGASISSTQVADPFGGTNAWQLTFATNNDSRIQQQVTTSNGAVYAFSVWARVTSGTKNVSIGAIGNLVSITLTTTWQRFESFAVETDTNGFPQIRKNNSEGEYTIEIYAFQLEVGTIASAYIDSGATTAQAGILEDMPRINYDANGENGALLLESSRTNVVTHSEYFGAWSAYRATITDNATTSPEGVINAAVLTEDTTNNSHPLNKTFSVSSGAEYTLSIFAKQGSRRYLALLALNGGSTIYYDLENKTAGSGGSVEDYGNGWLRLIYTYTTNSTSAELYIQPSINGSSVVYTGDGSNAVYLYGAQLEAGSYPSSIIPTHGAAVTRGADSCSVTGASDVIGQSEGTIFVDLADYDGNTHLVTLGDGTASNYIMLYISSGAIAWLSSGGLSGSSGSVTATSKAALAYKGNDSALYLDGTQILTNTSSTIPTIPNIYLNANANVQNQQHLQTKQVVLFNERLSNSELADLTS